MVRVVMELPPDVRPIVLNDGASFGVALSRNQARGVALVLFQDKSSGDLPLNVIEVGAQALRAYPVEP